MKDQRMKKAIIFILAVCITAIAGEFAYYAIKQKGPEDALNAYIAAVQDREFAIIFWLNYRTQKQMNILARADRREAEALVEKIYDGGERTFNSVKHTEDLSLTWAEKFFFVPEMEYTIVGVDKTRTAGSPSSDYRSKSTATALVTVTYLSPDTSPLYRYKKVREAKLEVHMIQSRDVVKGMHTKPVKEGWLYHWSKIDDSSVVYWTI